MVIAEGFERALADEKDPWRVSRAGHDWNQNVAESRRLKEKPIGKHVVILTTIGFFWPGGLRKSGLKCGELSD